MPTDDPFKVVNKTPDEIAAIGAACLAILAVIHIHKMLHDDDGNFIFDRVDEVDQELS